MIRNIIFDMGNVLLDYEPLLACYRHTRDWVVAEKLNKAIFGTHDWCTLVDGGLMDDKEYLKGAYYQVSPYSLIYTDDHYYLLAFVSEENKFKHFRVDHMENARVVDAVRDGAEEYKKLDMAAYNKYTFNMYGGDIEHVSLFHHNIHIIYQSRIIIPQKYSRIKQSSRLVTSVLIDLLQRLSHV